VPQLHDVSLTTDERQFLLFRDAMHFALGSRPDLHRAGVVVRGDTGFRLLQVDGATRVLDVWDWLVEHAQLLTEGAPRAAALVIPTQVDGSLRPAPAGEGIAPQPEAPVDVAPPQPPTAAEVAALPDLGAIEIPSPEPAPAPRRARAIKPKAEVATKPAEKPATKAKATAAPKAEKVTAPKKAPAKKPTKKADA